MLTAILTMITDAIGQRDQSPEHSQSKRGSTEEEQKDACGAAARTV